MLMAATKEKVRTRIGDLLSDYELQWWRKDKLAVVVKDYSESKKSFSPGAVLVRGLYPGSTHVEGFDGFAKGAYSARSGLERSGIKMLLQRGLLGEVGQLVHERVLTASKDSRLDDQHWSFRTKPLDEVRLRFATCNRLLRNQHMVQLNAILNTVVTRRDGRGRRNPGAASALLVSNRVLQLVRGRTGELDGTRVAAAERAHDVDNLIEQHVRVFSDLCSLMGTALFRGTPIVGALKGGDPIQLQKLIVNLEHLKPELEAMVALPFAQSARLCVRDIDLLFDLYRGWKPGFLGKAYELGLKLYTAGRNARVNDEVRRQHDMVARNIPYGQAPAVTIDAVHAATETVASWLELIPDAADRSLDHPFKKATKKAVQAARDLARMMQVSGSHTVNDLKGLKAALAIVSDTLMYGEVAA